MTGWDILDKFVSSFPPIVLALILVAVLAALVIFIVGFSRHGVNFLKYGFKQSDIADLGKKIDDLRTEFKTDLGKMATRDDMSRLDAKFVTMATRDDMSRLDAKIVTIETNHFGHLKNFLTELTSILLDKGVINNTDKARLDNELRGM
jgi:hypothetical protein